MRSYLYRISRPGSISLLLFTRGSLSVSRPRDSASALVVLRVAQAASGSNPFCKIVTRRRSVCTEMNDGRSMKLASRRQRNEFLAVCIVSGRIRRSGSKRDADYILAEVGFFPQVGRPSTEFLMLLWPTAGRVESEPILDCVHWRTRCYEVVGHLLSQRLDCRRWLRTRQDRE
jgi:hypothetical protein